MAITDNLVAQMQRIASDTSMREAIGDSSFTLTGTPTEETLGGELGWGLDAGEKATVTFPSISINENTLGGGITFALRVQFDTFEGSARPEICGVTTAFDNNIAGLFIGAENDTTLRVRHGTAGTVNITSGASTGTVKTFVVKLAAASGSDNNQVWVQGGDRTTNDPDFESTYTASGRTGINNLYINCPASTSMTVLDMAVWSDEKTDAECVSIADSYRAVVPTIGGGGGSSLIIDTTSKNTQIPDGTYDVVVDLESNDTRVGVISATVASGVLTLDTSEAVGTGLVGRVKDGNSPPVDGAVIYGVTVDGS